jgi:6-pyruvoyltetrahydropterin/6-carboxytetrahydropterin synthase
MKYQSTKVINLGSCAFRQPNAAFNRQDAGKNSSRCSKIHGYRLKAKFWFGCSELDDKNWVQDFGGFGPVKELFEHQFDHTTCLDANDPLLPLFEELDKQGGLDLRIMPEGTGIERIAKFCYDNMQDFVQKQSNGRVWVDRVEVFEHEDNSAIYDASKTPQELTYSLIGDGVTKSTSVSDSYTTPTTPTTVDSAPVSRTGPVGRPAPVGPSVTQGKGDWFSGTSWG